MPLPYKFSCEPGEINEYNFLMFLNKLSRSGLKLFKFVASPAYEVMQQEYAAVKNTMDPNAIFQFLNRQPFHCEALADTSEFFRLKGDYKVCFNS